MSPVLGTPCAALTSAMANNTEKTCAAMASVNKDETTDNEEVVGNEGIPNNKVSTKKKDSPNNKDTISNEDITIIEDIPNNNDTTNNEDIRNITDSANSEEITDKRRLTSEPLSEDTVVRKSIDNPTNQKNSEDPSKLENSEVLSEAISEDSIEPAKHGSSIDSTNRGGGDPANRESSEDPVKHGSSMDPTNRRERKNSESNEVSTKSESSIDPVNRRESEDHGSSEDAAKTRSSIDPTNRRESKNCEDPTKPESSIAPNNRRESENHESNEDLTKPESSIDLTNRTESENRKNSDYPSKHKSSMDPTNRRRSKNLESSTDPAKRGSSIDPMNRGSREDPVRDGNIIHPTITRSIENIANLNTNEDTTNRRKPLKPLIGVLDCGTRTCEFVVFRAQHTEPLVSHQIDIKQVSLSEGWLEENPLEMLRSLNECVKSVAKKLPMHGYHISDVKAIGITNQRETTVVWDRKTGKPLHNAICWSDTRTESTCEHVLAHLPDENKNHFKPICGLPVSPYFSVFKLMWLMENVPAVKKAYRNGSLMFGTVDSWILWNITGGTSGGIHATDVTNASRTMLMNLDTLNWDPILLHTFKINSDILPEIRSCSEIYGAVKKWSLLHGCPVSGIMGNQQSALVGQRCLSPGQAKNTYRSGCFLLYNTGGMKVMSSHGLVTTVAYQLGPLAKPVYALEGSVQVAGAALRWLRVNMGMIGESPESHKANSSVGHLAESDDQGINSTGDVYFVPAFKGLYAPYWRMDARGIICGLTAFTTRAHIVRAALESICFQTRDVLEAMHKDCGYSLTKLYVDGVMTLNPLLMQLQADIIGIPVVRAQTQDVTALGVAMAAGQARGIEIWDMSTQNLEKVPTETILPTTAEQERDSRYAKWKMAVQRSLGWVKTRRGRPMTEERYKLLASIPGGMFIFIGFGLLVLADKLAMS